MQTVPMTAETTSLTDGVEPEPNLFLQASQEEAAIFVAPSLEAQRLVRRLGWLVAPKPGEETLLSRAVGVVLVAPFTQLTFFSFDLQMFLYEIFHSTRWAKLGHFVFMPAVNFSVMVALTRLRVGPAAHEAQWLGLNGATLYGVILLAWYAAMANRDRLWLWWATMVPVVAALTVGATVVFNQTFVPDSAWYAPAPLAFNPFLWMAVAAFFVALSHAPEPLLPPRVTESSQWQSVPMYVLGPPGARHRIGVQLVRAVRVALQAVWGTLDEWWASPRLMPYGFLLLLMNAGYRPGLRDALQERVRRARASGNPALDYVGTGGGTFLRLPDGE